MEDNIIKHPQGTIIMNGGNPLPGCPESYEESDKWAENANGDKEKYSEPVWSFDCGFKLDFDGALIRISSRFYPPKTHYGPTWDGNVSVMIGDDTIEEKAFDCPTLEELRAEVELYVEGLKKRITFSHVKE